MATSMSPYLSDSERANSACVSVAAPSKATTSTTTPSERRPAAARSPASMSRQASTTVRVVGFSNWRTMARPMSLVPPSSTMVCGSPSAFSMGLQCRSGTVRSTRGGGRDRSATLHVGRPRRGSPSTRRGAGNRGARRRGHVRILGKVVTASGVEDDTVEAVQQVAEAARRAGHIERERPAGPRES